MNKIQATVIICLGFVFITLLYWFSLTAEKDNKALTILCTTNIIADTVKHISGSKAHVISLMGPGIDPHSYRAREHDMNFILQADVIFYNGLHLEGKMTDVFEKISHQKRVIALGDKIDADKLLATEYESIYDPHIWHDPKLWQIVARAIGDELSIVDQKNAEFYKYSTEEYIQQLQQLDSYVKERLAALPSSKRFLVTAHDAFQYFARAYKFTVVGLQGVSTEVEVSPHDIQELVSFISLHEIPAIFVESSLPHRNIIAVMEAVRAQSRSIHLGGELFSDALAKVNHPAGTYVGMIKYNVETIIAAMNQGHYA